VATKHIRRTEIQRFIAADFASWLLWLIAQVVYVPERALSASYVAHLSVIASYVAHLSVPVLGALFLWRARQTTRWPQWAAGAAILFLVCFGYREAVKFLLVLEGSDVASYLRGVNDVFVWHVLSIQGAYSRRAWSRVLIEIYSFVLMPALQISALIFVLRRSRAPSNPAPQPTAFGGG
jgi:hypothetical protein